MRERVRAAGQARFPNIPIQFFDDPPFCRGSPGVGVIPADLLPLLYRRANFSLSPEEAVYIAYGDIEAMDLAFLSGCVDYLVNPWLPEELFLRCGRRLPRNFIDFSWGRLRITPFALLSGNAAVALSPQEYRILRVLTDHINSIVPRTALYDCLGKQAYKSPRLVDVHVSNLRKKLRMCTPPCRSSGTVGNPIRMVRGVGYGLAADM